MLEPFGHVSNDPEVIALHLHQRLAVLASRGSGEHARGIAVLVVVPYAFCHYIGVPGGKLRQILVMGLGAELLEGADYKIS
jgi:hypothetical protein